MKKWISAKTSGLILIVLFIGVSIFHTAALLGFVPVDIIWGGRLKTQAELIQFETVSLAINLVMLAVVLAKAKYLKLPAKAVTVALWVMVVLFALNTIGNLFAEQTLETILFTPATFVSALLCLRLAID